MIDITQQYMKELNVLYNSQQSTIDSWPVEDFEFYVTPSADSNVTGTAQGTATLALPVGSKPLVDIQKFPGAVAAFVRISNIAIATRELTATITTLTVQYVDINKGIHNLFSFDSRTPAVPFTREPYMIPIPLTDPGRTDIGQIQLVVNASNAGAAHALTYDVYVAASIMYLLREKNDLLDHLHKQHGVFTEIKEAIQRLTHHITGQ